MSFKILADSIWLRNVYKAEFNSNGSLVHRASLRVIQCLIFLQVCTLLKFIGETNFEGVVCVIGVLVVTILVYNNNTLPFITPDILDLQRVRPSIQTLANWEVYFSHPIHKDEKYKNLIMPVFESNRSKR